MEDFLSISFIPAPNLRSVNQSETYNAHSPGEHESNQER